MQAEQVSYISAGRSQQRLQLELTAGELEQITELYKALSVQRRLPRHQLPGLATFNRMVATLRRAAISKES